MKQIIKIGDGKFEAMQEIQAPIDTTGVQIFIGLSQYLLGNLIENMNN